MKLLKNSTYNELVSSIEKTSHELRMLEKRNNLAVEINQLQVDRITKLENENAELSGKAEKWDAELKRQALKSKIARIKKMSTKQLASKYIDFECEGLKGRGKICGYDGNDIVIGLENNKGWSKSAGISIIMKEHTSYTLAILHDVKESIINSLK